MNESLVAQTSVCALCFLQLGSRRASALAVICASRSSLPWRPAELAAAEQVQVEMKNRLAGAGTIVEDRAISIEQIAFSGELRGNQMQLADDRLILVRRVVKRNEVLSRDKQNVRRRLRADVLERENVRVFVDNFGWNLLRSDFAE